MKHIKLLIAALALTTGGIATHAMADPCHKGIALHNPLTNLIEINGIDLGNGGTINANIAIDNNGLTVRTLTPGGAINTSNRFNQTNAQLELDCVVFNENTFRATLDVVQDGNDIKLPIANASPVFDAGLTRNWIVDYDNSFPNDPLTLGGDGSATLSTFPGAFRSELDQIAIDLGLSALIGTVSAGRINGTFSHFGETGSFFAIPAEFSQKAILNNGRFEVEVDWVSDTRKGKGDAVLATDDSASFFFFDSSNMDLLVRVLNSCDINDRYWVFAGGTTDVEYTLTVTDTNTGTVKAFNSLGAGAPIGDTNAFETCP